MLLSIYNISNTYTCLYVGIRHGDHSDLQRSFITIFYLLYYYVHSLSEINNIYLSIMSLCLTLCALVRSPTGFMIPAVAAVCVAYSTQVGVAIAFLTIGVGFTGVSRSGYAVNHVDIAPRYVLVSFRSLAAVVDGVLIPPLGHSEEYANTRSRCFVFLLTRSPHSRALRLHHPTPPLFHFRFQSSPIPVFQDSV